MVHRHVSLYWIPVTIKYRKLQFIGLLVQPVTKCVSNMFILHFSDRNETFSSKIMFLLN